MDWIGHEYWILCPVVLHPGLAFKSGISNKARSTDTRYLYVMFILFITKVGGYGLTATAGPARQSGLFSCNNSI